MSFASIDWHGWRAQEEATLLFIIKGRKVLLIDKKRGLGAGKVNGPGGRVESGESPQEAAEREVREELGVTALGVRKRGELCFQFTSGYALRCHVFSAADLDGEPLTTEEASPRWEDVHHLPFDQMWADDRVWLPMLIAGQDFRGNALFDGDHLLGHDIRSLPGPSPWR